VRVVRGAVFDVAVDIRRSSPTFGHWAGVELTEDNYRQLWLPPGFAHGFYVLSDIADFLYKTTEYYFSDFDRSILWNDPEIAIEWPIETGASPIVSSKDEKAASLVHAEVFE
jgi:dTDP-4-dehydrorhamnose 3,5-epimerase